MRKEPISAKHPALFAECFDFSMPEGWRGIVAALCDELAKDPAVRVVQVKEKFGELRFYVGEATSAQHDLINAACRKSRVTCSACGEPGTLRGGSWVRTLCEGCAK